MNKQQNIIITGAAGFISSCLVEFFNKSGLQNLILVDDFTKKEKHLNWQNKKYKYLVERDGLFEWLNNENVKVDFFVHLGARTDTTEFNYSIHEVLNVEYSKKVWAYCSEKNIPLIYASSAATYGAGEFGYEDNHEVIEILKPLNPYGVSKNEFDKWAVKQTSKPQFWAGLKFFNVYGPNEYHKGRMASVIWHSFNQIKTNGEVKLFRSHRPEFKDGEQLRDFIYVFDLLKVIYWIMDTIELTKWPATYNGLYNLGTGKARSFIDLVNATFNGLNLKPSIVFIDMPEDIREKYQYFTEANMAKLRNIGYTQPFYELEDGVIDYVQNYLLPGYIY